MVDLSSSLCKRLPEGNLSHWILEVTWVGNGGWFQVEASTWHQSNQYCSRISELGTPCDAHELPLFGIWWLPTSMGWKEIVAKTTRWCSNGTCHQKNAWSWPVLSLLHLTCRAWSVQLQTTHHLGQSNHQKIDKWRCLKMGVPQIIMFFSPWNEVDHPAIGVPPAIRKPPSVPSMV